MSKIQKWVSTGKMEEDVPRWERRIRPFIWAFIILSVCYFLVASLP